MAHDCLDLLPILFRFWAQKKREREKWRMKQEILKEEMKKLVNTVKWIKMNNMNKLIIRRVDE